MQHYNAPMKAILCRKLGPPETLTFEDIPPPNMGPSDVRINVHAAGVNFPDLLIIEGKYQLLSARCCFIRCILLTGSLLPSVLCRPLERRLRQFHHSEAS